MRKLLFLFLFLAALFLANTAAAQKFFTRDAKVKFNSDTPMEKIEAVNKSASCLLDTQSGKMAWKVLMKGFQFEKALMQEHFNENYVESSQYPNATFEGEIVNLKDINFSQDGKYNAITKGKMTIHGVTKDVEMPGVIKVSGGTVTLNSNFTLVCADYDIKIPAVVRDNIAKEIKVMVEGVLKPK